MNYPIKNLSDLFSQFKIRQMYGRQAWMLFLSRLLAVSSFAISMLFFSIYLHTELAVPLRTVGSLMMIAAFISSFAMMIGGGLSDKLGRKPLMWISTFLKALVFFAIAYVIKTGPNVLILTGLYMLARIMGALFMPASDAMLADIIAPEQRAKAYGVMRIFANAGFAIGPAVGGIVAEISYVYLFMLSAIMSIIGGLFILFFVKESLVVRKSEGSVFRNLLELKGDVKLLTFCLVSFLFFVVMGQFGVTFSLFSIEHVGISKAQFGRLFLLNALMVIFLQYPATLLVEKIRSMRKLQIGMIIYSVGFFSLGGADSLTFLMVSVIILTIGEMIFAPTANAVVANMAPEHAKGRYMGVFGLFRSFGWSIAPFIGGLLLNSFMEQGLILWGIIGIIGVIGTLGYVILEKTLFRNFA